MKTYFYALGLLIAFTLASCQSSKYNSEYVLFSKPQPMGEKDLPAIPKELRHTYINHADSSQLKIDAKGLYLKKHNFTILSLLHRDSSVSIISDSLVMDKDGRSYPAKKIGDSLLVDVSTVDTLFEIGEDRIIRKLGNDYVFNKRSEHGWIVYTINPNKKSLMLRSAAESDLKLLKSLGKSFSDTIPYQFELDKTQFKTFLKHGGFGNIDTLQLVQAN